LPELVEEEVRLSVDVVGLRSSWGLAKDAHPQDELLAEHADGL
jgi:hypothetical protein